MRPDLTGQYSSAIQAEHHRGKASRLYEEQQAVVRADADSPSAILERLNGLLSRDPSQRRTSAGIMRLGVPCMARLHAPAGPPHYRHT
eukprot:UN13507